MARSPSIEDRLIQQYGDLHKVIPDLAAQHGQEETARLLMVKQAWISRWLKENGYVQEVKYVQMEGEQAS